MIVSIKTYNYNTLLFYPDFNLIIEQKITSDLNNTKKCIL